MIPGKFEYHRPGTVGEVVALLSEHGDEGRVVAGGHSLIPMMKLRLAVPSHLIDLQGLESLKGITEDGGDIVLGGAGPCRTRPTHGFLGDRGGSGRRYARPKSRRRADRGF